MRRTVLVAGASGLVGYAVMKHYAAQPDTEVIAVSRRTPDDTFGARHVAVDLTDEAGCSALFGAMTGVTHLVYAALYEKPGLIDGWLADDQIDTNGRMLRNLFEPLLKAARGLRHVALLQGTKAYGAHVKQIDVPARPNRSEERTTRNFYWVQQDYLSSKQQGRDWALTILRPQIIFGFSLGSAMNLIPAIGAYAALLKEQRKPLSFPGGAPMVLEAVDADLLAQAIAWAGQAEVARGRIYNVTNGDVFVWHNVWPVIADALGMEVGPPQPMRLGHAMESRGADWEHLCRKHGLAAPGLKEFVGESFHYLDFAMAYGVERVSGLPPIVSTINLRRDGFQQVMDTEDMFRKWFHMYQGKRLLPLP